MSFNEIMCHVNTSLGLVGGMHPLHPPCVRGWLPYRKAQLCNSTDFVNTHLGKQKNEVQSMVNCYNCVTFLNRVS